MEGWAGRWLRSSGCRIWGFLFTDCRAEHIQLPGATSLQQSFIAPWDLCFMAAVRARLGNKGIFASSQEMLFTRACGEMIHSLQGWLCEHPTWIFLLLPLQQGEKIAQRLTKLNYRESIPELFIPFLGSKEEHPGILCFSSLQIKPQL